MIELVIYVNHDAEFTLRLLLYWSFYCECFTDLVMT